MNNYGRSTSGNVINTSKTEITNARRRKNIWRLHQENIDDMAQELTSLRDDMEMLKELLLSSTDKKE